MDKVIFLWLFLLNCWPNIVHAASFQFTNISCESTDPSLITVEQCFIGHVNQLTNFMNIRYALLRPIADDIGLHLQLLIRSNGWKPFLYALDVDVCRFMKSKYNAVARLIVGLGDGHTNANHKCPYNEKFIYIDRIMNTDISKKIRGLPLGSGNYAFSMKLSWKNETRIAVLVYFKILN